MYYEIMAIIKVSVVFLTAMEYIVALQNKRNDDNISMSIKVYLCEKQNNIAMCGQLF